MTPQFTGLGATGDLGAHKADLLRFMTGEEVISVAAFDSRAESTEVEDNAAPSWFSAEAGLQHFL